MYKIITKFFLKNYKQKKSKGPDIGVQKCLLDKKIEKKMKIIDEANKEFSPEGRRLLNKLNYIEILLSNLSQSI